MCSDHHSPPRDTLCLNASSLFSLQSTQASAGLYWPGMTGRKSLIGLPNNSWAGDRLSSLTGVLRCCRSACPTLSQIGLPSDLVLQAMNRQLLPSDLALQAMNRQPIKHWRCLVTKRLHSIPGHVRHRQVLSGQKGCQSKANASAIEST